MSSVTLASRMRRMMLGLATVGVVAVMMAISATPAFADVAIGGGHVAAAHAGAHAGR